MGTTGLQKQLAEQANKAEARTIGSEGAKAMYRALLDARLVAEANLHGLRPDELYRRVTALDASLREVGA